MDWGAVGAVAELLSAIAVIVSILYLGAQVRQGASDVRASIIHSLHANEIQIQAKPSTNVILARAIEKAYTDQTLTDDERAQFSMYFYAAMINFEQVYLEYKRLNVEPGLFVAHQTRISGGLKPSLTRAVWNRLKDRFTLEFQEYVDELILQYHTDA